MENVLEVMPEKLKELIDSGAIVLEGEGNGEEEETIRGSSSNIGNVFDSAWFRSLIPVPFYHSSILVPVGFREILTSFYGRNWRAMEKRRAWESITTDLRCKFDALPVCG